MSNPVVAKRVPMTTADPSNQSVIPGMRGIGPQHSGPLARSPRPDVANVTSHFRDGFTHWLYDETQDPYAQRAFRELLRNKDKRLRLEAWKVAAAVLAPITHAAFTGGKSDQKVAIQFVNKVARPAEKVVPTTATEESPE